MAYNTFAPIITDGMIIYFDPYNVKSYTGTGIYVNDLTRNAATGSISSNITFSDKSFVYNGIDTYFESGNTSDINGLANLSMSIWVYNTSDTGGLVNRYDNGVDSGFEVEFYTGDIYVAFSTVQYGVYTYGITNQWVNITTTYNGNNSPDVGGSNNSTLKLYINGIEVGMSYVGNIPTTVNHLGGTIPFLIGRVDPISNPSRYISGYISSVIVYNKTLSDAEVLYNYNSQKNRFIQ